MVLPLALIIIGLVIGVGGFVYTAKEWLGGETEKPLFERMFTNVFTDFDSLFSAHIKGMIIMAIGGLISMIGFILLIIWIVVRLTS